MALKKTVTLDSKVVVQHWFTYTWHVDIPTMSCDVTMARYTSKADRLAGATPVDYKQYHLVGATFPFDFTVQEKPIKKIEDRLSTFPEFSGAVSE